LDEWLEEHHCRAGSSLLMKWGFPQEFVNIAQHHDNPGDKDVTFELLVVHAAKEIVKSMGYVSAGSKETGPKDNNIIQELELTPQMIEDIKTQVKARMEQIKDYLG
jgi:HD-like signal output (HDOD) protein